MFKKISILIYTLFLCFALSSCSHAHKEGEWEITEHATCINEGTKEIKCLDCGEVLKTEKIDIEIHKYVGNICKMCFGVKPSYAPYPYEEDGVIYMDYGFYPQTVVSDPELNNILLALDVFGDDHMFPGCVKYNGDLYIRIYAITFSDGNYKFNNGDEIELGASYFFKVEPIKWRVYDITMGVTEDEKFIYNTNVYKLVSEYALYSYQFYYDWDSVRNIKLNEEDPGIDVYSNNYKYSSIRAWLNGYDGSDYSVLNYKKTGFYDFAFANYNLGHVLSSTVDNSLVSTTDKENPYVCDNTEDKIYLLSKADIDNPDYHLNDLSCIATDFARATGCWINTNAEHYGNTYWWLRTPSKDVASFASVVDRFGNVYYDDNGVSDLIAGVRPAMKVSVTQTYIKTDED